MRDGVGELERTYFTVVLLRCLLWNKVLVLEFKFWIIPTCRALYCQKMSKIYPVYVFNIYVKSYTTKLPTLPQTIKYKFRLQTNRSKTSKIQTLSMLRFIKINIISNKTICITGLTLQVLSYNYVRKHTTNRQLMIFLKQNKSPFLHKLRSHVYLVHI